MVERVEIMTNDEKDDVPGDYIDSYRSAYRMANQHRAKTYHDK